MLPFPPWKHPTLKLCTHHLDDDLNILSWFFTQYLTMFHIFFIIGLSPSPNYLTLKTRTNRSIKKKNSFLPANSIQFLTILHPSVPKVPPVVQVIHPQVSRLEGSRASAGDARRTLPTPPGSPGWNNDVDFSVAKSMGKSMGFVFCLEIWHHEKWWILRKKIGDFSWNLKRFDGDFSWNLGVDLTVIY